MRLSKNLIILALIGSISVEQVMAIQMTHSHRHHEEPAHKNATVAAFAEPA